MVLVKLQELWKEKYLGVGLAWKFPKADASKRVTAGVTKQHQVLLETRFPKEGTGAFFQNIMVCLLGKINCRHKLIIPVQLG